VTVGGPNDPNASPVGPYADQCFGREQGACARAEGCKYYGRRAYSGKGGCVTVGGPNDPDAYSNLRGDQLKRDQELQRQKRERLERRKQQKRKQNRGNPFVRLYGGKDKCFGKDQSACDRTTGCKYYGRRAYNGKGGCVTVGGPNDPDA